MFLQGNLKGAVLGINFWVIYFFCWLKYLSLCYIRFLYQLRTGASFAHRVTFGNVWRYFRLFYWESIQHLPSFLGGSGGKVSACSAGDLGSISGLARSPGELHGSQSSTRAWRIPMGRGAWQAAVHGAAKRWTRLSNYTQHWGSIEHLPRYKEMSGIYVGQAKDVANILQCRGQSLRQRISGPQWC